MVLIIGFVLAGWQVTGVIWANALAAAATGLCYGSLAWVLIRRTWGGSVFDGNLKALKDRWREIFAFIAYTDLTALVATIPNQLDLIVLGYFRGPTEVGYYKLAKSISLVVRYLTKPLQTVSYPMLARLTALGHKHAFCEKVRKLLTWIGLPLGALVLLGAGVHFVCLTNACRRGLSSRASCDSIAMHRFRSLPCVFLDPPGLSGNGQGSANVYYKFLCDCCLRAILSIRCTGMGLHGSSGLDAGVATCRNCSFCFVAMEAGHCTSKRSTEPVAA